MAQKATCDRCNQPIPNGSGYYFYSSVSLESLGLKRTGAMMLCKACTNAIIKSENWRKPASGADLYVLECRVADVIFNIRERLGNQALSSDELLKAEKLELSEAIQRANDAHIVAHCMNQDLSPEEARTKAQEFAKRWWEDPKAAEAECTAYWKSSAKDRKAAAEPRSSRSRIGCLIGCGLTLFFSVGACAVAVTIAMVMMTREENAVRDEAAPFLRLIADGKTTEAYNAMAMEYRAETKEAAFAEELKKLDLAGHTGWEEKKMRHSKSRWILEGFATGPGARVVPVSMEFVNEGGQWRPRSIQRAELGK